MPFHFVPELRACCYVDDHCVDYEFLKKKNNKTLKNHILGLWMQSTEISELTYLTL